MLKQTCYLLVVVFLLLPGLAAAQETTEVTLEPVVVTATRIEIPFEEVGKTVTVVTADQLEDEKATSLVEALQHIPGILARQQRRGGLASIKIRGLDTEYTQILVNGLPVRDPSDPQGSAVEFMGDLVIEDIERIEVVRGSSSTLYGSDSVGGTINIITKKGTATPEFSASFEGGSYSTYQEVVGLRGMAGSMNYAVTGKRVDSDGLDDHDEYSDTSVAGRFGIDFSPETSLMFQMKYADSEADLNDSPGIVDGVLIEDQDDPDDAKDKTLLSGGAVFTQQISDKLDYSLKFGYVDVDRDLTFGPEGDEAGFGSDVTYAGNTLNAEVQANYSLNEANLLTMGYEYESEEFEQELGDRKDTPDATRHAVYLQDSLFLLDDQFTIVPGVRYMDHDQVGDRIDWEVSVSYVLADSGTRLHSHVGTGFRAPSLYELFGASVFGGDLFEFGNEDLDPEESLGWDVGIEFQVFEENARLDVTYFSIEFDEIIAFGTDGFENVDGGESKGVEVETTYFLTDAFEVRGSYTYTETEDANGEQFFGVPEHELGVSMDYRFLERFTTNLAVTWKGEEDIPLFNSTTFTSERYTTDSYTTVDFALDYAFSDTANIWTRIENLLDEEYTIGGYEAPGISFYGGIKITL
ncbi:TonB-dependent receptor [candidate division KSB3 bacterium]|uniref:TonB-dependent receptor n=1 Tax=candidate division KSB3 bacterium TaxID=2044937 RepID=A0A9D5JYF3_9BACT|nr:TonB-dependent receptor [candidate division KSB3 bacterium]MBD3326455.1 TonB-dependent receptor [candidate division KSB3 bacterium]